MDASDRRQGNLGYFNADAALSRPDKTALIDLSGEAPREITHAALDERMSRVAAALTGLGLRAGDRLLIAMGNRAEFIEAFFGAMRAGIVPLPLNTKFGAEVIAYVIADAGCAAALVEPACNPHVVALAEKAGLRPRLAIDAPAGWQDYEAALAAADPAGFVPPAIAPGQLAFTPYTSGSTGRPKGVMLTHSGLLWAIRSTQRFFPTAPEDRALVASPLFHKNAMRVSIKPSLHAGASAVILRAFEPSAFLEALARYQCTHTGGVPAMYRMALEQKDLLARLEFPRLKSLAMGSAVVGRDLMDAVERTFGVAATESYGLTEAGGPLRAPIDGRPVPLGSCGVPAPEWEAKLVDDKGRESDVGELWVRAPSVMTGYINRPDLTRERLIDGWLRTGDVLRRDADGFYYFQGRTDDMFSCGGENIYPKEVELMLVSHPAVLDAAVFAAPHAVKGLAPSALVVLRKGKSTSEEDLKRHCLEAGPAYAHPRHVFFVDALPASTTGKLDRKAVRELGLKLIDKARASA